MAAEGPFVRRARVDRVTWDNAAGGRLEPLHYAVGRRLANWGNNDGSRCYPGIARLAKDARRSTRTVRRALASLRESGWLHVARRGARKLGEADTYVLTVPAAIGVELGLWTDGDPEWIERPATDFKRRFLEDTGVPCNGAFLGDTSVPKNGFQGTPVSSRKNVLEDKTSRFLGDTRVPPPSSYYPEKKAAAVASAALAPERQLPAGFKPEDPNADEVLIKHVEHHLGHPITMHTQLMISTRLTGRSSPVAVMNAAIENEAKSEAIKNGKAPRTGNGSPPFRRRAPVPDAPREMPPPEAPGEGLNINKEWN